jgi:hypothetical protein
LPAFAGQTTTAAAPIKWPVFGPAISFLEYGDDFGYEWRCLFTAASNRILGGFYG